MFVIGDLARCLDASGQPLPGLAAVAIQQGSFVAQRISQLVAGRSPSVSFQYRNRGTMATIGRAAAVAQMGKRQFCGAFAWVMWLTIHLMLIVQFQNRILVFFQWGWNYVTFGRSARLITGEERVVNVHHGDKRMENSGPRLENHA